MESLARNAEMAAVAKGNGGDSVVTWRRAE
jgi:hypothetical protein